ncbi:MAG TPA: hypothetical protein VNO54_20005, partial [Streptosporangiaceae bacterium]|nr:hypothetical protein [Streptosporangiaceae bacterium]
SQRDQRPFTPEERLIELRASRIYAQLAAEGPARIRTEGRRLTATRYGRPRSPGGFSAGGPARAARPGAVRAVRGRVVLLLC